MCIYTNSLSNIIVSYINSSTNTSTLFWEDKIIQSAEGVQQGDPLGPLLFCLTFQQLKPQLTSEFKVFYLDDGTLGGSIEDLRHDLRVVEKVGQEIGLQLNEEKTEVICCCQEARESVLSSLPGALVVENEEATLLGSPIGGVSAISTALREKVDALKIMGGRLAHLATHDALLLVKHSFALPKLLHCLRTAPCFLSPGLQEYDSHLKAIVSEITNIHFPNESPSWIQASLPVRSLEG